MQPREEGPFPALGGLYCTTDGRRWFRIGDAGRLAQGELVLVDCATLARTAVSAGEAARLEISPREALTILERCVLEPMRDSARRLYADLERMLDAAVAGDRDRCERIRVEVEKSARSLGISCEELGLDALHVGHPELAKPEEVEAIRRALTDGAREAEEMTLGLLSLIPRAAPSENRPEID